ncbi:DEAD/DEAH box helicase [Aureivirga sp. CE67]|uniref:DEAD/DEAH box helicase n=1 Tax=Aureivirga sp. CE67 TaxID=1788983 RepID=UPI0018C978EC|nr:DEAD/DEAH box helicase [Aureivirga sp. CE67]
MQKEIDIKNLIKYYRNCYQSDNRDTIITDFLNPKIINKYCIETREELLTGDSPIIPIPEKKAAAILKKIELYDREKEFIYASFFVTGYLLKNEKKQKITAPLFYYKATIEQREDLYFISLDIESRKINYSLLQLLEEDDVIDYEAFYKELPKSFITYEEIGKIVKQLNKYFPMIKCDEVYMYPDNIKASKLKAYLKSIEDSTSTNLSLLAASYIGLIDKSNAARGILNELELIANSEDYSKPLKSLFLEEKHEFENYKSFDKRNIPLGLSKAQESIIEAAKNYPFNVIYGPPGTGKTYTIGALALEHVRNGESVLIASRTDEAVDVVVDKIRTQIGIDQIVVRAGKKRKYKTPFSRYIKSLLSSKDVLSYLIRQLRISIYSPVSSRIEKDIEENEEILNYYLKEDFKLKEQFKEQISTELVNGLFLSENEKGIFSYLKKKYLNYKFNKEEELQGILEKINKNEFLIIEKSDLIIRLKLVYQIHEAFRDYWNVLKDFRDAMNFENDTGKAKVYNELNFDAVLKAFPIWALNMSNVKEVLPLKKEMFDVVIIDEATQCDIASCLPLFQRAKRVVIAGDTNQLRHISFLSKSMQQILQSKYNVHHFPDIFLNYREKSILDVGIKSIKSEKQLTMLDEHFRSLPTIIEFSNEKFYNNDLRIMTKKPDSYQKSIFHIEANGTRDEVGINSEEIKELLENIKETIEREADEYKDYSTIGVLSPFKDQAEALHQKIHETFTTHEIEKHKMRVGTAYSFQGEERDEMHLSFAVDANSHHSAFVHLNKEAVFNVAITRAKSRQYIYTSISKNALKSESLFYFYLDSISRNSQTNKNIGDVYDNFLDEVIETLKGKKVEHFWKGIEIAGITLDLLIKYDGKYFGIDLIGYPGEFAHDLGLEQYKILERAEVKTTILSYSSWIFEKERTISRLLQFLYKNSYS